MVAVCALWTFHIFLLPVFAQGDLARVSARFDLVGTAQDTDWRAVVGKGDTQLENVEVTWNKRMCVITSFSLVTVISDYKRIRYSMAEYIQTHLAYVSILFNFLLDLFPLCIPILILTR